MPQKLSAVALAFVVAVLALQTSGCRPSPSPKIAAEYLEKTFPVRGKVLSTDATHVMLDHEAVPGFMEAMTMAYKLKDPSIVSELHPGDRITARIVVQQDASGFRDAELDNIVVIAQARPDYKPPVQYHTPQVGDAVPDFRMLNQSGRTISLSQFKGKVLVATFIYTRCPLADYCPRMSRNFAEIDKTLGEDPALYGQTHLLSISFDPAYDTPAVLRSYGGAYTGNYTKETFKHWDFAAPPEKELAQVTQFFGVGVTPGENKTLNHSLSTAVIGKDGRIAAWYPTNDWKPEEVVAAVKKAAAS
ncbi:SCO family protein [Edaphobacter aggregans]|uniref:SCO family protein n=1 Tax=Edaphobacter aggregans TaxID=570835 RepID=UPI00055414DD|nr:SCO family protein [Edaphobacter aggregans]